MMFKKIFIEERVLEHEVTRRIRNKYPQAATEIIENYSDWFGRVRKPYLEKRDNLFLYLATKQGELVKPAPDAYGTPGEPHYYFLHSYNCIYECEYCYLQGYFQSPDIVLFLNYDDIFAAIADTGKKHNGKVWFHAGEFSDSLALNHLTGELPRMLAFFRAHPQFQLELRTKSANIAALLREQPAENLFVSFSISPDKYTRTIDRKTAPLNARLRAAAQLAQTGYSIGFHCDPIIYSPDAKKNYHELALLIKEMIGINAVAYISLGALRFAEESYRAARANYPESIMFLDEFTRGSDGKIRYPRPLRQMLLKETESAFLEVGFQKEQLYYCMEV